MARLDGRFIKGTAGPVVYKQYRDKQIVQSRPEFTPGSQSKATKEAASSFAFASKLAMNIRDNFAPVVTDFFDGPMINRMNSEAIYIMGQSFNPKTKVFNFNSESFSRLNGFEFNMTSPVRDNFFVQPKLSVAGNVLNVNVPELHLPHELKFPKDGSVCMLSFATGMFDLKHGRMQLSPIQSSYIEYSFAPMVVPEKEFDFEIESGCLCIQVISMHFIRTTFAGTMIVNTKSFNPVAILKAFIAEGDVDIDRTKNWKAMNLKTG